MLLFVALLPACLVNTELYERRKEELSDHDGDSFTAIDDCDDAAPDVFPGAVEVCDGIDNDCQGGVDNDATDATAWYPDMDLDGYGATTAAPVVACEAPAGSVANLLDCDDTTNSIRPGVEDVPYNGVDEDCHEGDLVDVDGDGSDASVAGGDDCDDAAAGVHPEAVEVPYDGVDQDCQGGDAEDLDGDGSAGMEAGGGDCDDADAARFPGAGETWADGFTDNDCDSVNEPAVLEFGAEVWSGWRAGDQQGRRTAALGDLDGDGLDDVLVGSEYDSTLGENSGGVYALDGAATGSLEVARALLPDVPGLFFASDVDAGVDVTGDGVADLLISSVGSADVVGTAWIVDGADWLTEGDATIGEVQAGSVVGSAPGTYGPTSVKFVGDVSGDGIEDIALGECCGTSSGSSTLGRVAIFSSDAFSGSIEDAEVLIDGWENIYIGGDIDSLGDQDGDGLDDLLVGGLGGVAAAVVGGRSSGLLVNLAITLVYGDPSTSYSPRNVGDLDGDGRDDMAILGNDEEGLIYLFNALGASPTHGVDSPYCVFDWSEHGGVHDIVPLGDRDGDDRADLFIPQFYSDSGNQRAWILPGSALSFGGSVEAGSSTLSAVSLVPTAGFGYSAALAGDVDGDGQDDILIGAPAYSATEEDAGAATLLPVPQ